MHAARGAMVALLALLLPHGGLSGQLMPGGRTVDVARLRGDFYSQMVEKVTEVMDAWQGVWQDAGEPSLPAFYSRDATLLQPGGMPLKGRGEIGSFSQAAIPFMSALRTGMQDLEACEGFAYLSGYFAMDPPRAEGGAAGGRHVTVIQKEGKDWLIRSQFFLPDSGTPPFPGVIPAELLPPLTPDRVRTGPRGAARFEALGDAEYVLMALRDAWKRGDVRDAASFFAGDAWVRLPNETENRAGMLSLEERLREGMDRFGEVLSVELDFDRRDRLSFLFGRYHAEGTEGPDRSGHFFMLLRNAGNGWLIRSLVFS